jgi:hypothetical protein
MKAMAIPMTIIWPEEYVFVSDPALLAFRFSTRARPPTPPLSRGVLRRHLSFYQALPLGLQIPEDHPDRNRYLSLESRPRWANPSNVADLALSPGDILFLYTDGVYDGSDDKQRVELESLMHEHCLLSGKGICNVLLEYALKQDEHFRETGEQDRVDDKTVFIIKRS